MEDPCNISGFARGAWSQSEDALLLEIIRSQGAANWVKISRLVVTRSPSQCRERYLQEIKPDQRHGPIVVTRSPLQCRERYLQELKPNLRLGPMTPEEWELYEDSMSQMRNRWVEYAPTPKRTGFGTSIEPLAFAEADCLSPPFDMQSVPSCDSGYASNYTSPGTHPSNPAKDYPIGFLPSRVDVIGLSWPMGWESRFVNESRTDERGPQYQNSSQRDCHKWPLRNSDDEILKYDSHTSRAWPLAVPEVEETVAFEPGYSQGGADLGGTFVPPTQVSYTMMRMTNVPHDS